MTETHRLPCCHDCVVVGELDPDLEHALRAWWVDYAYANDLDSPREECECCRYRWEVDDDSEWATHDPYLALARAKWWAEHAERHRRLHEDLAASSRAFWEMFHDRTGWLSGCGGAALAADVLRETRMGLGR